MTCMAASTSVAAMAAVAPVGVAAVHEEVQRDEGYQQ